MSRQIWSFLDYLKYQCPRREQPAASTFTTPPVPCPDTVWRYQFPPIYFLRWGSLRRLDGTVKAKTKSEARAIVCRDYGLDRFPIGGRIEAVPPVEDGRGGDAASRATKPKEGGR